MARKRKLTPTTADRSEMLALLDAAKDDPFDPSRRLVLADWLEEHGGESDRARAEVIRLQLESESGGIPWVRAAEKLRDKWVRAWMGEANIGMCRAGYPVCESGLLTAVTAAKSWPRDAAADEAWRWVETARQHYSRPGHLATMAASPLAKTVTALHLDGRTPLPLSMRPLLAAMTSLRRLSFWANVSDLEAFARNLPAGLVHLSVAAIGLVDALAWDSLLASDAVAGLSSLTVAVPVPAARSRTAGLSNLRRLAGDFRSGDGVHLADWCPPGLRSLTTRSYHDFDEYVRLADSPCGATLEELTLCVGGPVDQTPAPFRLPRLRRLVLRSGINPASVARFAEAGGFAGPSWLDLSSNRGFAPDAVAALCASLPRGPRRLELAGCHMGDQGVRRLAAWPGLADERVLVLATNGVTDVGLRSLAESPHAANVEALSVAGNFDITAAGADALMASPLGKNLRWLSMDLPFGWKEPVIDETTRLREYVRDGRA